MKPLPRSFYLHSTLQVAHDLLGKHIIRRCKNTLLIGKIVEVEAYGRNDPASHAYGGKTNRNSVMFGEGGHLYVYFTYGMHYCANIVTGKEGTGEAVLIRAIEPLAGLEIMHENRNHSPQSMYLPSLSYKLLINLTNGPAKFCKAFNISTQENGFDLTESSIILTDGESVPPRLISQSARIGIHVGLEKQWRFFVRGNSWVSR